MRCKKYLQQIGIADDFGIKGNADGFCMPGLTAANLFICGVNRGPANISALHAVHAIQLAKNSFGAPETTSGENRFIM
jgi:hypothetical protein